MKRNCGAILVLRYSVLVALALFLSACATKVIDIDKSIPKLELSEEQAEVVEPKMASIKEIVDIYSAKKEVVEEELGGMGGSGMKGGGGRGRGGSSGMRGELRERMQEFRNQRETYLSAINTHIADIKAVLNEEQLATFEKMKQPKLEMPEMPGGRGGGGGMGGGKGGGGGRRGGGMF